MTITHHGAPEAAFYCAFDFHDRAARVPIRKATAVARDPAGSGCGLGGFPGNSAWTDEEPKTMPLTVTRDGAPPVILSLQTVFDQLPSDTDIGNLLHRVSRLGECVAVCFRDGATGTIQSLNAEVDPNPPAQQALALLPRLARQPLRTFELDVKILFEVDGQVSCQARDKHHETAMVQEIFAGSRPPENFTLAVAREQMLETFRGVDAALSQEDVSRLPCFRDVLINHIEER
jgi:hypothetical protein